LNAKEAENVANYALTTANNRGSFVARNAVHRKLRSATYDAAIVEVVLTPRTPVALTRSLELVINAQPPRGLQDSSGAFIDGNAEGHAGDDGVFVINRKDVTRTYEQKP